MAGPGPTGHGLVLTGARAQLSIGGTPVAYCTNVSYSEEIEHTPIETLDNYEVQENVPIAYRVTFTAQWVRVITNPLKNRDGVTIFPTVSDILSSPELTATVTDSGGSPQTNGGTGTVIANIERVKAARYSVAVPARGNVFTDCEFNAIRITDESEIS